MKRPYRSELRAQQASQTHDRLLDAAERLFASEPFDRVTLAAVAAAAGVTVTTVQRKFGHKEGLFAACGARLRARVHAQRGAAPAGGVEGAVRQLVAHYEAEGALMWHLLRQEASVPALAAPLAEGRRVHRAWVERAFASAVTDAPPRARRQRVDALVAATDLFTWKLLRHDLGRSRADVESTLVAMVAAFAGAP